MGYEREIKPENLVERFPLYDQEGNFLYNVSFIQGRHGLNRDALRLELDPISLHLTVPVDEHQQYLRKMTKAEVKGKYPARTGKLYGDFRVQHPSGTDMFLSSADRILWYLNRDLLQVISAKPPVLRFVEIPAGYGNRHDEYSLSPKDNKCVVCGKEEHLSRHHVVPRFFRRHMPEHIKKNSHDVLLLCVDCHETYERHADDLKTEIAEELGIKLVKAQYVNRDRVWAKKSATALIKHTHVMPDDKKERLTKIVQEYLGQEDFTPEELAGVAALDPSETDSDLHFPAYVLQQKDLMPFIERWRRHFVDTMKPPYLPEKWAVDYVIPFKDESEPVS